MIILSRLFFSVARGTNPEGLPQLSGACLYSNPPLLLSLRVFLTPPSFGHLPYILLCKTQRRRGYLILLLSLPMFFNPSVFLTPSPYGHSPYLICDEQRERSPDFCHLHCRYFLTPPSLRDTSPIFYMAKHPAMLRGTAREDCDTKDFLSQSKKVLVTLICSCF